jgi:hypothetical protein
MKREIISNNQIRKAVLDILDPILGDLCPADEEVTIVEDLIFEITDWVEDAYKIGRDEEFQSILEQLEQEKIATTYWRNLTNDITRNITAIKKRLWAIFPDMKIIKERLGNDLENYERVAHVIESTVSFASALTGLGADD